MPGLASPTGEVEVADIYGVPTEFIIRRPKGAETDLNKPRIFLIPGNPGVVWYYEDFLRLLQADLGEDYEVGTVGHAGHSSLRCTSGSFFPRLYTLQDQIEHKIAFFDELRAKAGPRPLILIGHSVGSYMALQVMKRRPDLDIIHFCGVFPMIHHFDHCCPLVVKTLMQPGVLHAASLVTAAVGCLPVRMLQPIMGSLFGLPIDAGRVTHANLLNLGCAMNILHLTRSESTTVKAIDVDHLAELAQELRPSAQHRLSFVFTERDTWAPLHLRDLLRRSLPTVPVLDAPAGVPHSFPVAHTKPMTTFLSHLLRKVLQ